MTIQKELIRSFTVNSARCAVEFNGQAISYSALSAATGKISNFLLQRRTAEQTVVGVCLRNRYDIIRSMIGIMNARCVFVPLDETMPDSRFKAILSDLDIRFVITAEDSAKREILRQPSIASFFLDTMLQGNDSAGSDANLPDYDADDDLYVYFTSGSTGRPKGIVGINRSLLQFVKWEIPTFGIDEKTRISQFISPYFDAFLRDIFVPLIAGGTICIPPADEDFFSPEKLVPWIDRSGINLIHCVPSQFRVFNDSTLSPAHFKSLKYVLLSGEKIIPSELLNWYERFGARIQLVNLYGATETTMIRSFYLIQPEDAKTSRIPIGQPISDTELLILDSAMKPCNTLVTGDLYIVSEYMTRGYLNPEQTREKFVMINGGKRAFRTGDKARRLANGTIDLLGREDRQVKISGVRVELDEIEGAMIQSPGVRRAAVVKQQDAAGKEVLIAFVAKEDSHEKNGPFQDDLRHYLESLLPRYMIPALIEELDELPLLSNGKTDYNALSHKVVARPVVAPANETESKLLSLWKEIVGDKPISTEESFLAVGGNSLAMMKLIGRIYKEFGVKITLIELFRNLTIKGQARLLVKEEIPEKTHLANVTNGLAHISNGANGKAQLTGSERVNGALHPGVRPGKTRLQKAETRAYYKLSVAQQRIYYLCQLDSASLAFNLPSVIKMDGLLDKGKFKATLQGLVDRQESLRTSFQMIHEQPVQVIRDEVNFNVEYFQAEEASIDTIVANFVRPFDLHHGPLFRVGLIETAPLVHYLLVDIHHIITDAASIGLLVRDFVSLYRGIQLPACTFTYKDFAEWQQSAAYQREFSSLKEFWVRQFSEPIRPLDIPVDFVKASVVEGGNVDLVLDRSQTQKLQDLAKAETVTMPMLVMSAFNILLSRLANQDDIVVGLAVSGRETPELEDMIGMFPVILPLRSYPKPHLSFRQYLASLRSAWLETLDSQRYQYEDLARELNMERSTARNPWFDVMFLYQNFDRHTLSIPGLVLSEYKELGTVAYKNLNLIAHEHDGQLFLRLVYAKALFRQETVDRFARYFQEILGVVVSDPDVALRNIQMTSRREREDFLRSFDTGRVIDRGKVFSHLFGDQVKRTPHRIAVEHNGIPLTYKELDDRAKILALALLPGDSTNKNVATFLPRGIDLTTGIVAILHAGATYVPIDVDFPKQRIQQILADSGAETVLIHSDNIPLMEEITQSLQRIKRIVCIDQPAVANGKTKAEEVSMDDLAYIIYTSGTTGKPKGVMIHHLGLMNHLYAMIDILQLTEADSIAQTASPCSDISVWQFLTAFLVGGKTCIVDKEKLFDLQRLNETLLHGSVTIFQSVPSILTGLLDEQVTAEHHALSRLRWMIPTGEQVSVALTRKWYERFPGIPLLNAYGPTEASDDVTTFVVEPPVDGQLYIPIGKPIQNMRVYIVDDYLNLCPPGVKGEICVAGLGVGKGYWEDPGKTAKAFVPNPFVDQHEADYGVLYKTGDLGYYRINGDVICTGRKDDQVKIRGFRIELSEIINQLSLHPLIKEVTVIDREVAGSRHLIAYYVPTANLDPVELRNYLSDTLPGYMVPAYFMPLEKMPLTTSGKIDKRALPEVTGNNLQSTYEAPQNELQATLLNIWKNYLGRDVIGIHDNFFELGGHSLSAMRLVAVLKKELNVDIPIKTLMHLNTVDSISRWIELNQMDDVPELESYDEIRM